MPAAAMPAQSALRRSRLLPRPHAAARVVAAETCRDHRQRLPPGPAHGRRRAAGAARMNLSRLSMRATSLSRREFAAVEPFGAEDALLLAVAERLVERLHLAVVRPGH